MSRGPFISFEGGEASGKSTQIRLLSDRLGALGRRVVVVREPGGTPLGERLRLLLKQEPEGRGMAAETELLLMNASRAELVRKVIRPALEDGAVVLCDRFLDSTTAYQGAGRGLEAGMVAAVVAAAVGSTRPDRTFWLRVPLEQSRRRLQSRSASGPPAVDRFEEEQDAFFERVEKAYGEILRLEPGRFVAVDGQGSPEEVADRIWTHVGPLLGNND